MNISMQQVYKIFNRYKISIVAERNYTVYKACSFLNFADESLYSQGSLMDDFFVLVNI